MTDRCQHYLEDPERHAAHLAECADCRRMAEGLAQSLDGRVRVDMLPLATWEGASYRSWPLVLSAALAVIAIAAAFFAAAGSSPLKVAGMSMPSTDLLMSMVRLTSGAIQNAPTSWQIGIGISFVVVNALFIVLLRRAPKGIDV
jgi:hypothetical protein